MRGLRWIIPAGRHAALADLRGVRRRRDRGARDRSGGVRRRRRRRERRLGRRAPLRYAAAARAAAAAIFDDDSVVQYHDRDGLAGVAFADGLLERPPAWDVYMVYAAGATWDDRPPTPDAWLATR